MENNIEGKLDLIKKELLSTDSEMFLRKHIIFGDSFWLDSVLYYELKEEIASHFKVHPSCVFLVGSGKLGFSLSEKKVFDSETKELKETKPRFRAFGDESDLDIAIVSPSLFNDYWRQVYTYSRENPSWYKGKQFKQNMFEGWMRPDQLPSSPGKFQVRKEWFSYFSKLTASGKYGDLTIAAGLYADWQFVEAYQLKSINECKTFLELEE
ncbi:hypothetical protein AAFX60_017160 [Aliivibrio fischeri]